jgi:probable rRNA maturation factor
MFDTSVAALPTEQQYGAFIMLEDQVEYDIDIEIDDQFTGRIDSEFLAATLINALRQEDIEDGAVTIVVTDDQSIQELNERFLGIDAPTDVLSFPLVPGEDEEPFIVPDDTIQEIGEIVISLPTAERQAQESGISLEDEIAHLLTHGALHLIGYDHIDPEEDRRMRLREESLLADLGITVRHSQDGH